MSVNTIISLFISELQLSVLFSQPGTSKYSPSVIINNLIKEEGSSWSIWTSNVLTFKELHEAVFKLLEPSLDTISVGFCETSRRSFYPLPKDLPFSIPCVFSLYGLQLNHCCPCSINYACKCFQFLKLIYPVKQLKFMLCHVLYHVVLQHCYTILYRSATYIMQQGISCIPCLVLSTRQNSLHEAVKI